MMLPFRLALMCALIAAAVSAQPCQPCNGWNLEFDGLDDEAVLSTTPALDGLADFTLELWLRCDVVRRQGVIAAAYGNSGSRADDALDVEVVGASGSSYAPTTPPGGLVLTLGGSAGASELHLGTQSVVADGTWHHVAFTRVGSAVRIVIDGAEDSAASFPSTLNSSGQPVVLGTVRHATPSTIFFQGGVDSVRLWGVGRTNQDIATLRTQQVAAGFPGLIAAWELEEGMGQTLDSTPAGLTGHLGRTPAPEPVDPTWASRGTPAPSFTVNADPVLGLQLRVSDPSNPGGTLFLWMCDYLQPTWVGPYLSQLPLLPSAAYANGTGLITIADDFSLFGPPASPYASLDASGEWGLTFPTAILHYIYGFPAQDIHFEATVIDWSAPAAPDAVTVLPVQTFRKPQFP